MDLMKIGLYALAGYGAYSLYERMSSGSGEAMSEFRGTNWQEGNMQGTPWQRYNEFRGTNWQESNRQGTDWQKYNEFRGTNWQEGNMQGTDWQRYNEMAGGKMSNACGGCS